VAMRARWSEPKKKWKFAETSYYASSLQGEKT